MKIPFHILLVLIVCLVTLAQVQAATVTTTIGCGEHGNACSIGAIPTTFVQSDPGVPEVGSSLGERFDTFDTIYFDVEGNNRLLKGSVTPSMDLIGFDGGVFDNDRDAWWGKFVDLDKDGGTYTLIKTDEEGNFDLNSFETALVLPELDIESPRYHLHFYTEKHSGNLDYSYEFTLTAAAVPVPAAVWIMLSGLAVLGGRGINRSWSYKTY